MPSAPKPDQAATGEAPLDVIMINDFVELTGGTDRVALAEAAGLARRGHRVTLVAGHGEPDAGLLEAGVSVRHTRQQTMLADPRRLRAGSQGIWNRTSAALVREVASRAEAQSTVVHVHGFTKVLSASVVRAAVESGLPTIVTLHDYFAACPNGGFYNYQRDETCPLTPLSAKCVATHCDVRSYSHKLWRVGRSVIQKHVGRLPGGVDRFIVPSRFAADILRPFLPPRAPLHVLSNPVRVSRAPAANVAENAPFVLVGRLQRDKGGIILAEAARQAGVPVIFVGDGDEASLIRRANPEAELTGWLDSERVQSIVRGARAAVHASRIYETQGLAVLEAAAHGVPSVVSDASVARESVTDGTTGLWFSSGDVSDLADKLVRLHADPPLAARMGAAAYERFWSDPPDLARHLDRLEEIYRAPRSS
jgi:glycosyltransferase involved in cell wall biosynthesis